MIYEIKQTKSAEKLFDGWQETMIWSCLQRVMGHLYADDNEKPESAAALLGDFCFLAGKPSHELAQYVCERRCHEFIIMVPQNEAWAKLLESCYGERAKKVSRYAFKKKPDIFDMEVLNKAVDSLPDEYTIKMMDENLFYRCREISWCRDWVSLYNDYEMYRKYGLGAVVLKDDEIVSGASSYSSYIGGIEVEIDTKEEYRRKGLAFACGAELILECLERGLYPSWDAQNKWSAALAMKLGYYFDYEYTAYEMY